MSTTKLPDTQLVILSEAAQRPKLRVLPTPPTLEANTRAITRALNSLLKRGLIAESPARKSDQEFRRDESGSPLTLVITPDGLKMIGVDDQTEGASREGGTEAATELNRRTAEVRVGASDSPPGTKGAEITALLRRKEGATLPELTEATGWQAHSVRGFLSGTLKKKLGYTVTSEPDEEGVRRYRLAA